MYPTKILLQSVRSVASSVARDRTKTIGFIGLGAMGREMASNLVAKTFAANPDPQTSFVVHDSFDQPVTRFLTTNTTLYPGRNIVPASSPAGVARLSSTIITMLPSSPEVKEVYSGEEGILDGIRAQSSSGTANEGASQKPLCIDCTTLDPEVAVQMAKLVKEAGGDMLDAPVSGGVVGARAATLSFMVGSDSREAFVRAEELLKLMGSRAIHCGKNGNGLIAKIANNLLLGISMLGVSEAMLLGTAHGLPADLLAHIINTSTGRCWASEVNNPAPGALKGTQQSPPADRDYEGGFASRLMSKDLALAMRAARMEGVPTPLGQLSSSIYEALGRSEDFKDKDFGIAFRALAGALGRSEFREEYSEKTEKEMASKAGQRSA